MRRIAAARSRACDRSHLRAATVQFHERLGRGADDDAFAELAVIHVRRGIEQPQRAIGLERIEVAAAREPHRQHELVHVARGDVFLGAGHVMQERVFRQARFGRAELRLPGGAWQPATQRTNDFATQREAFLLRTRVQQGRAARQVIENEQRARRNVVRIGRVVVRAAQSHGRRSK